MGNSMGSGEEIPITRYLAETEVSSRKWRIQTGSLSSCFLASNGSDSAGATIVNIPLQIRQARGKYKCLPPEPNGVVREDEEGEVGGVKRARFQAKTEIEEESTLWGMLEEELQEKIIARLPIASLYRALTSSKVWLEKFKDRSFQEEVSCAAIKWPVYFPIHVNNKGLIGYDNTSLNWKKLFSFTHVPPGLDPPTLELCSGAGSLICFARSRRCHKKAMSLINEVGMKDGGIAPMEEMAFFRRKDHWVRNSRMSIALLEQEFDIYATNVITKRMRQLPPRPKMQRPHVMHMMRTELGGYSLILLTRVQLEDYASSNLASVCTQIYDSATDSWTVVYCITPQFQMRNSVFACSDKTIYILCLDTCKVYNLEHRKWNDIPLPCFIEQSEAAASVAMAQVHAGVVLCNSSVMLVMAWNGVYAPGHHVKRSARERAVIVVYKLDRELLEFVPVSRGPPETIKQAAEAYIDVIAGHGDYIYFGSRYVPRSPVFKYHFCSQQWSSFPSAIRNSRFHDCLENLHWANFAFQPGLDPFAQV